MNRPDPADTDVTPDERALLDSDVGREFRQGAEAETAAEDDVVKPIGAQRKGEETNVHLDGMDGDETEDGLSDAEEALRRSVEDREDTVDRESIPVFDRGDTLPRV